MESESNDEIAEQQEQLTRTNLVRIGVREVDSYANIALRYLQQHGSAVIGARGNRCGKAIVVYERMRRLGFIEANKTPLTEIGIDVLKVGNSGDRVLGKTTYRKPYIRITVNRIGTSNGIPVAGEFVE